MLAVIGMITAVNCVSPQICCDVCDGVSGLSLSLRFQSFSKPVTSAVQRKRRHTRKLNNDLKGQLRMKS